MEILSGDKRRKGIFCIRCHQHTDHKSNAHNRGANAYEMMARPVAEKRGVRFIAGQSSTKLVSGWGTGRHPGHISFFAYVSSWFQPFRAWVLPKCFRCSIFGPLLLCRSATSKFCVSFQKFPKIESETSYTLLGQCPSCLIWHTISAT